MTTFEEVRIFMDEFFAAISPKLLNSPDDMPAVMSHYLLPLILIDGSTVMTMPAEKDVAKKLLGGMAANAESGWASTRTDNTEIFVMNSSLALVSRCFSRLREDDSVLKEGGCLYTLIKVDGHWKVSVCVYHGAEDRLIAE